IVLLDPLFLVGTIPTSPWYYLNDSVHLPRSDPIKVYAARLLCIGRYEELKARGEAERKKEESKETDVESLKGKLQKLDKDKTDLEARVVELAVEKKEAETSEGNHGYPMLEIGFERARKQAEFFYPDLKFDNLDPIKVVHNGALVDDDEVDVEGGGDHNPKE
ncbi:hypothetical protein PIB30_066427, partial [Stylosanthes scabra]|nr:hypothetical protein [Stylosanthes scabra]